ncbi:MAG: distant relative of cell wall-associated hydrolase, partial [Comamonadaceae bacterium]
MPCGLVRGLACIFALAMPLLLGACASRIDLPTEDAPLRLRVQHSSIAPGNGGTLVDATALEAGDILLTSVETLNSIGIRLGTFSPVSHAVLYLGDGQIAEAVGTGVRARSIGEVLDEEHMVVAFRPQGLLPAHAEKMRDWALTQVGTRYNTTGVLLQAPFVLNRRVCELP